MLGISLFAFASMPHMRLINRIEDHPATVALISVLVSLYIFRKELSQSYYTLERKHFDEIFSETITKEIPEKIHELYNASKETWSEKFEDLSDVLEHLPSAAKYVQYSMPFFIII